MQDSHTKLIGLLLTAKYTKEKIVRDPKGSNAIHSCSDKLIEPMNLYTFLNHIDP